VHPFQSLWFRGLIGCGLLLLGLSAVDLRALLVKWLQQNRQEPIVAEELPPPPQGTAPVQPSGLTIDGLDAPAPESLQTPTVTAAATENPPGTIVPLSYATATTVAPATAQLATENEVAQSPFERAFASAHAELSSGAKLEALQSFSELYWKYPDEVSRYAGPLQQLAQEVFFAPAGVDLPQDKVLPGETLIEFAQRQHLTPLYLARLNQLSATDLPAGRSLRTVPGPLGVVIERDTLRLTVHCRGLFVRAYRILRPLAPVDEQLVVQLQTTSRSAGVPGALWFATPAAPAGVIVTADSAGSPDTGLPIGAVLIHVAPADVRELHDLLVPQSELSFR
jgi:hypothetical protein